MLEAILFNKSRPLKQRLIFCTNQITVVIAQGLSTHESEFIVNTVIYWPDRCDVSILKNDGILCIPYSKINYLQYLIRFCLKRNTEICIPHYKLGREIEWFIRLFPIVSLIDDGLDTFRNVPNNVDVKRFATHTKFYTFKYECMLGVWLEKFTITKIAKISTLRKIDRECIRLNDLHSLIIESPPLNRVINELQLLGDKAMLVIHSNRNKRILERLKMQAVNGAHISLERSIESFSGNLIVGESMVAVYALMHDTPKYRLLIYISKEQVENLKPLISLIDSKIFSEYILC
jgi:hypothetical protein